MIQFIILLCVGIAATVVSVLVFIGMAVLYDDFQHTKRKTKELKEEIIKLRDEMQQDNGWMYK